MVCVTALSVDVPKMPVHKFDIKRALADIQSVDRGDVTEIMSIPPGVLTAGRSTPVLATGISKQPGSEPRSDSPRMTGMRRASAVDERQSLALSRNVHKVSADLSKSSEQLDGIVRLGGSNHVTGALPESRDMVDGSISVRVDGNLDDVVKKTSASEENLLSAEHRLNDVTDIKQLARLQEESKSCLDCKS